MRLGVNVDHVATLRQARGTDYPDPVQAAQLAIEAGADGITVHLREDRRHIQQHDVERLLATAYRINLEMAATPAMVELACELKPHAVCIVPERREELTTEGGLNVLQAGSALKDACTRLKQAGIEVSLFIDPDFEQIQAAQDCAVPVIELHTGTYADANTQLQAEYLQSLQTAAHYAHERGLQVNAGHGLHIDNVKPIAAIPEMVELNIGHALVADALWLGFHDAVKRMKQLIMS